MDQCKRRFVICFDGTWNTPDLGSKPTNVVNMVRAIRSRDDDGNSQLVFYDKGVGSGNVLDRYLGGLFGIGLTDNVVDGYRFVANNFEPGDEIYIFGFSRGAYTARSLAGLIGLAGLLTPNNLGRDLKQVIDIYRLPPTEVPREEKLRRIGKLGLEPRRETRIKCVGVWDTVGSLGIPGDLGRNFLKGKYYFHDVELGTYVDVALHAVAVDEKRSAFSPTLWVSDTGRPLGDGQVVEQVWFAGAHSNVGGSYSDSTLSDIAFDWMARRVAKLTGLALDHPVAPACGPADAAARSIDSRSALYFISGVYPYQRIINAKIPEGGGLGGWFRRRCPKYDRRNIPPRELKTVNEKLHISVLERWRQDRVPHDCKTDGDGRQVPYRPVTLGAVIAAHHAGKTTPVVGWDGEETADPGVWPPAPQ